jgi:hypothetical protein
MIFREWHYIYIHNVTEQKTPIMKNAASTKTIILLQVLDIELKGIIETDLQKFKMKQRNKNSLEFIRQLIAA